MIDNQSSWRRLTRKRFWAAVRLYAELNTAMANWLPREREVFDLNGSRIMSLYASGDLEAGISVARALIKQGTSRGGETHPETAAARGVLAVGLMKAGRDAEAAREFRSAIPLLSAAVRENTDDENTSVRPILAIHRETRRAYCRVVMFRSGKRRLETKYRRLDFGCFDVSIERFPRLLGELEASRLSGFSLPYGRPIKRRSMRSDMLDREVHNITAPQFAVDSHVKHSQNPQAPVDPEFGSY